LKRAELASGVVVGDRYRLLDILGRGGYGDVWLAERLADGVRVAVKFYHDPERGQAFLRQEADLAKQFDHDHLVRVFAAGPVEGLFCMEMEYVAGQTLSRRITGTEGNSPPTLQEVLDWMEQIAEGLAYLHGRDTAVSHGDIKLDNLLLTPAGCVKIADFGLSRVDDRERFAPTELGGTWLYMAPERLGLEHEQPGCASDIYSFGVTFYRILTGRFPRRTTNEVYNLTPIPRLCELNSAIPAPVDDFISRCLEKKPDQRFANGSDLIIALHDVRAQLTCSMGTVVPVGTAEPMRSSDGPYDLVEEAYALAHRGELLAAVERLACALTQISTNPRILEFFASLNQQVGRTQAARATYERVARWQDARGVPLSERRETLAQLGELLIVEKSYEDAVRTYALLHEAHPDDVLLNVKYGIALGLAARPFDSIKILEDVRGRRPHSALVLAKIGFAYLQGRNVSQAEQYFNEALILDEFEPTALYHLAILRYIGGMPDRARRYFDRLSQVEGQEAQVRDLAMKLGILSPNVSARTEL
jgi:eukaryotic-like serine/threonine-protein kinase